MKAWRFDIAARRCGSARVNLNPFFMSLGDYVVVYGLDANGQAIGVERIGGKGWRGQGEVNSRRLWAEQIVVELHATSPSSHFSLTYVHYADCYIDHSKVSKPDSYCALADWRNMACFSSVPKIYELGPSVFRLRVVRNGTAGTCTAWKSGREGRFVSNNHCLPDQTVVSTGELDYKYDTTTCDGDTGSAAAVYNADTLISTDATLDFTVFTVKENLSSVKCLVRSTTMPTTSDRILIIHHPDGDYKKISFKSTTDAGGFCIIQATCRNNQTTCYNCDTSEGSSGSPVIYKASSGVLSVFALHFGHYTGPTGCPNYGTKIQYVKDLGTCP